VISSCTNPREQRNFSKLNILPYMEDHNPELKRNANKKTGLHKKLIRTMFLRQEGKKGRNRTEGSQA